MTRQLMVAYVALAFIAGAGLGIAAWLEVPDVIHEELGPIHPVHLGLGSWVTSCLLVVSRLACEPWGTTSGFLRDNRNDK